MSGAAAQVSCVAENRPDWYRKVENLAISVRNFGGRLASAQFVAHFVGGVDEARGRLLRELGVELRGVPRYLAPQPTTNKLRMFEHFARESDADLLVALDCDTVVVNDFLDEASADAVAAVPARISPLDAEGWQRLLARLTLPQSPTPTVMFETGQAVPAPYVNSGVLLVPRCHAEGLVAGWTTFVDRFSAEAGAGTQAPWTGYMMDQVALACALLDRKIPVRLLGLDVNLSTARNPVARQERADALRGGGPGRVKLLHYHRNVSHGARLLHAEKGSPLNGVIDHVNRVVAARAGSPWQRGGGQLRLPGTSRGVRWLSGAVARRRTPAATSGAVSSAWRRGRPTP